MKTSRILLSLLALATIVGCSEGNEENQVVNPNEGDVSYLAVKLKAAGDLSRAEDTDFEDGSDAENAVESAVFFFFDADGDPANVIEPSLGSKVNYYSTELTFTTETEDANIEEVANPVVVISGYKEAVPTQMFTILNYTYAGASLTLDEVRDLTSAIKSSDKFVMATSVYAEDDQDVVTSTISGVNVANSESAAKASPVVVHVERLASKVTLTVANPDGFDLSAKAAGKDVKVKVINWGLVSTQDQTKIVKDINPAWTDVDLGFAWNDPTHYRSYWATSVQSWGANFNTFTLDEMTSLPAGSEYCGENTYATAENRTKVVVIAQLLDKSKSPDTPVELAKWLGVQYAGEDALLQAVAGTLASTIFSGVDNGGGVTYTSISKDDIKCVATAGYTVTFAPSDAGVAKTWYSKSGATYTPITIATELAKIAPAQVYNDGKTYYTVDVRHLATPGSGKDGEFGVVRNHSYQINITDIEGFGTPIYNMEQEIVNPEDPADHESYIASEVKILAWRLVNQDAVLGQ